MRIAGLDPRPREGDTGGAHQSVAGGRELAYPLSSTAHHRRSETTRQGGQGSKEAKTKELEYQAAEGSAGLNEYPPHGEKQLRGRHSRHAHRMELYI